MKYYLVLLLFGLTFLLQSCGNKQVEANEKFREEVIAVHDEVMPKMGQLKSLEKTALQMIEELSRSPEPNQERIDALKTLAAELDQAYEGMFVWMRQYEVEDGEKNPEEVKAYLEEQMVKVTKVNEDIKNVLNKADSLIKQ